MDDIEFTYNYGAGHMILHCDNFFPCTKSNLKKIINLADDYNVTLDIYKYIKWRISSEKGDLHSLKCEFPETHQEMCDLQHVVDDKKHANGLPVTKEEMKVLKGELKDLKKTVKSMVQDIKETEKRIQKFQVNLDMLEERVGVV